VSDWKVGRVNVERHPTGYRTKVRLVQKERIAEPVQVEFRLCGGAAPVCERAMLRPGEEDRTDNPQVTVRRVDDSVWEMEIDAGCRPVQIEVDPDHRVLDADWRDNLWKFEPEIRLTPLYTPIDESMMVHPLYRPSIVAGPNVDIDGRIGLRGSLVRSYHYRISPFLAYDPNDAQWTIGGEGEWLNALAPNVSLGFRYDQTLSSALFNDPKYQGRLFARWTRLYTTSLIYQNNAFVEAFVRFGDNFYPDEDFRPPMNPRVEDYRQIRAAGVTVHFDSSMPYWNPERGFRFDATYEYGFRAFNAGETFQRGWAQASAVRKLPDGMGWLSLTRVAGRVSAGLGAPDNGEHFRFGGPLRFRGQRSEDTEGNAFWLASADYRFPLIASMDAPIMDNLLNWESLYGSFFYDVGESYLMDSSQGVDHALGTGLYFQFAAVSFLDRLTVRLEYAHSLRDRANVAWFGLYYAF
jgi:hypothetical protein